MHPSTTLINHYIKQEAIMQKITPFLWFDKEADEAVNFYVETFKNSPMKEAADSKIVHIQRYPEDMQVGPVPDMGGKVLTAVFRLAGQQFMALDGGPYFKFTEAISLYVECENQQEVDYFWSKLSAVPASEQCGWVKDKYGLSWQIVPKLLGELMSDPDKEKSGRVMQAVLQMKKLDVAALQAAYDGR
jgi:predicted 3-demethylubiquinone-9 3-methyltransferase (glyoxalase superfamily)